MPISTINYRGRVYPRNWGVYTWQFNQWIKDYDLPNPNYTLGLIEEVDSIREETLIDGDKSYLIPEKASKKSDIELTWMRRDDYNNGLRDQLNTYLANGLKLRITSPWNDIFDGWISRIEAYMIPGRSYSKDARKKHNLILTFVQDNT
jgi:hypothetical protein